MAHGSSGRATPCLPQGPHPPGGGGTHRPTQGSQGCPPTGGPGASPCPGRNHLRFGGLPPGTGHALPVPVDQAALSIHGGQTLDPGDPNHPHTSRGRPRHTEGPPPQATRSPQLRVPRRGQSPQAMGLSPGLKYPLPTTDQEVHQIRTCSCKILPAAAMDGKLLLQTARPTRDHTCTLLQGDTNTDTPHANPAPRPPALHSHSPTSGPNMPTGAHSPGLHHTGLSFPARRPAHARGGRSRHANLAASHTRQPTPYRYEESHTPRHTPAAQ